MNPSNASRSQHQGDIQVPFVSSTSNIKPRIRHIRTDHIGLYYPFQSTYFLHPILIYLFVVLRVLICKCFRLHSILSYLIIYLYMFTANQTVVIKTTGLSTSRALTLVAIIFVLSLLALGLLYSQFPELEEREKQHMKLPLDLEDAKQLGLVLDRYKEKYFYQVLLGVLLVYIFLQTFAIPGSIFLSILSGFLFPFYLALLLVCCCSAIGASLCFFLSNLLGKRLVKKFFPEKAEQWSMAVTKHKNNLLNYIIFLRVTPFLPNWFINMCAPVIGVPLVPFALGTFIGVAPPSFVAIQAGQTLHTLTSTSDAWSWTSVTVLSIFALISLVPVLLKQKLREKFD